MATPRPGGNITGLYILAPIALAGDRLRLLREAAPGLSRVGLLWNPVDIQPPLLARETERVARAMGVQLKLLEVQRARTIIDFAGRHVHAPTFELGEWVIPQG